MNSFPDINHLKASFRDVCKTYLEKDKITKKLTDENSRIGSAILSYALTLTETPGRLVVLHVEDDELLTDFIVETLKSVKSSIVCLPVKTLRLALDILSLDLQIDCILLDLNLPDSRGFGTLDAIRKANPEIPVVILSASSIDLKICQEYGAQGVLNKIPLSFLSIFSEISQAILRKNMRV